MNDTILSKRQKAILNIISSQDEVSREEIAQQLASGYEVSKPTIIRDLDVLIKQGFIRTRGDARAHKYFSATQNPLLKVFDVDEYFKSEPDKRVGVKTTFDFEIFEHLSSLYLDSEKNLLKKTSRSFSKAEQSVDPTIIKRELERFVIELSWKSSQIEGNTYTLLETESLIKDKTLARGKKKEEAVMILNHKAAFETILSHKNDFAVLNISNISQLHNVLVKDLEVTTGLRKHAVGITGTTYRPLDNQHQVREALEKLISIVNKNKNPLEKALIICAMIPYIQPFSDGNKRTARMLANAVLLAADLYPLSYRSVGEDEFKKALILFYEQNSIVYCKKLFIEQFIFANQTYFRS